MTRTIGFAADCDQSVGSFILQANSGGVICPAERGGDQRARGAEDFAGICRPRRAVGSGKDRAPFDLREGEAPLLESLEKFRGGVHRTSLFKMEDQIMNESVKTKKALRGSLFALFLCIVLLIGTTFA